MRKIERESGGGSARDREWERESAQERESAGERAAERAVRESPGWGSKSSLIWEQ